MKTFVLLCLTILILLAGTLELSAFANAITGEVVGVADGDTITVRAASQQHKIRLNGIDALESAQLFGQESKQNLSDLLFGE